VKQQKINIIFVDTFRASAGGIKEEKAEEIRKFFNLFKSFKDSGVAVVFLDHCRKPNNFEGKIPKKEQVFSSQDKVASTDLLMMLRSEDDSIEVYQRKNRLGIEIKPFKILMTDTFVEDKPTKTELTYAGEIEDGESKKEQAKKVILDILFLEGGKTRQDLLEMLFKASKIGGRNASEALRELESETKIKMTKQGKKNFYFIPTEENDPEILSPS
jgi:hypothetical protein